MRASVENLVVPRGSSMHEKIPQMEKKKILIFWTRVNKAGGHAEISNFLKHGNFWSQNKLKFCYVFKQKPPYEKIQKHT